MLYLGLMIVLTCSCGLSQRGADNLLPAFPQISLYPERQASSLEKWYRAKALFMAVEGRADQVQVLPRTAALERAQGLRCGNDPIDTGVTQELRTGWPFDHAVKMPLNHGHYLPKSPTSLCRRACGRYLRGLPFLSRGAHLTADT